MSEPVTAAAAPVATGRLQEQREGLIVLAVPGTDYRLHLVVDAPLRGSVGERIGGTIRVTARRVDKVPSGGRYIEPIFGRPRRIQGRVLAVDPGANSITVQCGVPVTAMLGDVRQKPGDFVPGQMVSFDAEPGARFEPTNP